MQQLSSRSASGWQSELKEACVSSGHLWPGGQCSGRPEMLVKVNLHRCGTVLADAFSPADLQRYLIADVCILRVAVAI